MADEDCTPGSYDVEECCTTPLQGGGNTDVGSSVEGPPGPQGPPGSSMFPFVFVFGDGVTGPQVGAKVVISCPSNGTVRAWQIRTVNDFAGTVSFTVKKASGPIGTLAAVGGTQPSITNSVGQRVTSVDWTIQTIAQGDSLEAVLDACDVLGVTLIVEYE